MAVEYDLLVPPPLDDPEAAGTVGELLKLTDGQLYYYANNPFGYHPVGLSIPERIPFVYLQSQLQLDPVATIANNASFIFTLRGTNGNGLYLIATDSTNHKNHALFVVGGNTIQAIAGGGDLEWLNPTDNVKPNKLNVQIRTDRRIQAHNRLGTTVKVALWSVMP
jgi:hypothetical protein